MAIAPSKLGRFVTQEWRSDDALVARLREEGLIAAEAADADVHAAIARARAEQPPVTQGQRTFNSPNERVRVFLEPFLSPKGRRWAVPLDSLNLPDE